MKHNIIKRVVMLYAAIALFSFSGFCQGNVDIRYPLDVTMSLSGNYGELRTNHFHGGVDFRVGGVVGANIYAAADGYISRISISPSGYGNALYLTHSNGFVTVYGHMLCFRDDIQSFVRAKQYEDEAFRQDIYLDESAFPVKKGDKIGQAGNSGSSGGPHLHFEVRDADNLPLNTFERGILNIPDKTSPIINGVVFYGVDNSFGVVRPYYIGRQYSGQAYSSKYGAGGVIKLPAKFYIGIDAIDKQEATNAKLAVNEYKVYLDTALVFHLTIGEVPFDYGRYINSLIEFRQRVALGKYYIKSYVEPGNLLKDRIYKKDNGLIVLNDTLVHKLKVEALDYSKNKTSKVYSIKRCDSLFTKCVSDTVSGSLVPWFLPGFYSSENIKVFIPAASLYNSIYLNVDSLDKRLTPYSPLWRINSEDVALHRAINISIKCNLPSELISKAVIAQVYKGNLSSVGGEYDSLSSCMKANVLSFGSYTVAVDLNAPKITPSIANNAVVKGDNITFKISDDLSGFKSYKVEIDGHWSLAEYDAKTRRVIVPLKYAKIKKGIRHNIVIEAVDGVGNVATVKRLFTW